MKKLTAKEYYTLEQDYYLDNRNVADCKFRHAIDDETTLYAISENEDQFFISSIGKDDVFYIDITPTEFLSRKSAASALGSIRTPKKSASSRENGKKGGRPATIIGLSNGSTFWVDKIQNDKKISKYMAKKCAIKYYRKAYAVKDVDISDMAKHMTILSHPTQWEIML